LYPIIGLDINQPDSAWQRLDPRGNRWDFAIGYKHENRSDEFIYWVETHIGSDGQISLLFKKLLWLKNWGDIIHKRFHPSQSTGRSGTLLLRLSVSYSGKSQN
jgi:hypothetical protein